MGCDTPPQNSDSSKRFTIEVKDFSLDGTTSSYDNANALYRF
jgi:hypothetical protein